MKKIVIKRDGAEVKFNENKIAVAIKKGFDSIDNNDKYYTNKETKYSGDDIHRVYELVIREINEDDSDKIKIEDIQDIIEEKLEILNYIDVKESFAKYRNMRNKSRRAFKRQQHEFLKTLESLSMQSANDSDVKRENANVDGNSSMGTMLQYGAAVGKSFAKAYCLDETHSMAHEEGRIHIHDMDFLPIGTVTCCQIDLSKLFEKGFDTGHGFLRTPQSIGSYASLAAIAIQANQNDQHGGQSTPAFDYYLAPGVLKSFKKEMKQLTYDLLDVQNLLNQINFDDVVKVINNLNSIDVNLDVFNEFYINDNIKITFEKAYNKALAKTDRLTFQAMEAFVHNLNTMHSRAGAQVPFSSINFGTDISSEGRMVVKNLLLATKKGLGNGETPIFPISIFKVKEGVNFNPEDPNYDLFKLSCEVSAKRLFPNFSFIDAPFNKKYYKENDVNTEVAYMGCRTRVLGNVDKSNEVVTGRGNLSFTTINLPRLGIKYGIINNEKSNFDGFYRELDELIDMVKDQLLDRFKLQCKKHVYNFPFLMKQGVWTKSDELDITDDLSEVLKQGALTIGFIGLGECLKALVGKHHGESKESQKLGLEIIKHMNKRTDEFTKKYNLNFSVVATPAEGLSGRFTKIDRSLFGNIEGITNRDYYTNSFHVPVYYDISAKEKIEIEAPYHELTAGGHISYIELDGDTTNNIDAFEKVIRIMKEKGIGYGAINHPVDRDPVCGFTGIIEDVCPGCNRTEEDGVLFERIRRITGYLAGSVERFNNAKRSEEKDRVKHG
ncbi:MAG: anaerobic ribonucleoside triphosphate reductase [Bacilli bacterium]